MKKVHKFSKKIVVFCIVEMCLVQLWSFYIFHRTGLSANELLVTNHAVFGGELVLLCLKRLLTKEGQNNEGNTYIDSNEIEQ